MLLRISLPLIALSTVLPAMAQAQSVNDFTLEPAPTPTATPQAQGPADTRSGVEIRPRAVNTPAATPAPEPTPTNAQVAQPPAVQPTSSAPMPRSPPLPTITPRPVETSPVRTQAPTAPAVRETPAIEAGAPALEPVATLSPTPISQPQGGAFEADAGGDEWPWLPIGGAVALLALLIAGLFAWRRRRDAYVPEIERPVIVPPTRPEPVALAEALQLRVEHDKLIRSAAFATLKYRMTLINRTDTALSDISVGLDLASAHAGAPMEEQIATDAGALEKRHEIARIAPRQSVTLEGQVQLPLAQAHVIRQGRYPLLVPLMRVGIEGPGKGALLKTFVVGQGAPGGGRVQPFRLDEGPRSYAPIAQRELA